MVVRVYNECCREQNKGVVKNAFCRNVLGDISHSELMFHGRQNLLYVQLSMQIRRIPNQNRQTCFMFD